MVSLQTPSPRHRKTRYMLQYEKYIALIPSTPFFFPIPPPTHPHLTDEAGCSPRTAGLPPWPGSGAQSSLPPRQPPAAPSAGCGP